MLKEEVDRTLKISIPEYEVLFDSKKKEYVVNKKKILKQTKSPTQ